MKTMERVIQKRNRAEAKLRSPNIALMIVPRFSSIDLRRVQGTYEAADSLRGGVV